MIFCLLSFIRPEYLTRISIIKSGYYIYRIVVVISIFLLFLIKKKQLNKFSLLWVFFEIWIIIMTILNKGNIIYAFFQGLSIISIAILFQMYIDQIGSLLKNIYRVLSFFVLINFFTIIFFPNGMYTTGVTNLATENWFLGFKNEQTPYFLTLVGIMLILSEVEKYNKKKILMLIVVILSAIIIKSSTLIVGLFILLILALFPFIRRNYQLFNISSYIVTSLFLFIAIPIFRLQNIFSYIIINMLNKDVNFTNRTVIWDTTLNYIKFKPISGFGEQIPKIRNLMYNSFSVVSSHNQIMEYLYTGGILLIIIYLFILFTIAKELYPLKSNNIIIISSSLFFALQVVFLTEVFTSAAVFMIYFIVYYSKKLVK